MARVVSIKAPAKINLFLQVLGRREDGYHQISSLMQMVGLYDDLTFEESSHKVSLRVAGLPIVGESPNLIVVAARLLQNQVEAARGKAASISLTKRIPVSAGLGGGSSNAAATLIGLNRLWSLGLSLDQLSLLGARIGSDVPFFLHGPTAWVGGRGEIVAPDAPLPEYFVVLVNTGAAVSTAWAYQQFSRSDRLTNGDQPISMNDLKIFKFSTTEILLRPRNDLEEVTFSAFPSLVRIKRRLCDLGGKGVLMSGSGPTVFALFEEFPSAKQAASALSCEGQTWVIKSLRRRPSVRLRKKSLSVEGHLA